MYSNLNLEQLKLILKQIKKDIIITKISRNIIACEFHGVIAIELYKLIYECITTNLKTLSRDIPFWFNKNSDLLIVSIVLILGMLWVNYQNELNNLFEMNDELKNEQENRIKFIK